MPPECPADPILLDLNNVLVFCRQVPP